MIDGRWRLRRLQAIDLRGECDTGSACLRVQQTPCTDAKKADFIERADNPIYAV
jgi:hypothetical protein